MDYGAPAVFPCGRGDLPPANPVSRTARSRLKKKRFQKPSLPNNNSGRARLRLSCTAGPGSKLRDFQGRNRFSQHKACTKQPIDAPQRDPAAYGTTKRDIRQACLRRMTLASGTSSDIDSESRSTGGETAVWPGGYASRCSVELKFAPIKTGLPERI